MTADGTPLDVSVVVLSWNTRELLAACLEHLFASHPRPAEVIVVDNASEDGSADMVEREFPAAVLVRNAENEGFARGCNIGIERATKRHVFLLNSDTEVAPDAIGLLGAWLDGHPDYGACAPKLVHRDGSVQRTCMRFPNFWTPLFFMTPLERWLPESRELRRYFLRDWDHLSSRDVDQPPAAALMVRREVLEELGAFDEQLWLFFNDVDLSKRMAEAGLRTRYVAEARVVHHVGASTSKFADFAGEYHRNRLVYYRKHFGRLVGPWIKLCVTTSFVDHCLTQWLSRLRGRPAQPVGDVARSFVAFLRA